MLAANEATMKNSTVIVVLKKMEILKIVGKSAFSGNVDQDLALALWKDAVRFYNHKAEGVVLAKGSSNETVLKGFSGYNNVVAKYNMERQQASSIYLTRNFMLHKAEKVWPSLHTLVSKIVALFPSFHLLLAHLIYCNNGVVAFQFHKDSKEHTLGTKIQTVGAGRRNGDRTSGSTGTASESFASRPASY